jgi:hypothetical protein
VDFLDLLTWIITDHDGEEVQPHGQDEIGSDALQAPVFFLSLFYISHALHIARQSWLGARGCIHHTVKDTNVQKNTLKQFDGEASGEEMLHGLC